MEVLTSKAVQANDHTSDEGDISASSSSRNSGACHRRGPTSGLDKVYPVDPPNSSITLDKPKSQSAARPSSVIRTLFFRGNELGV
jgi:hypothetical protein